MHAWQRLLWKEFRESGPFVFIGMSVLVLLLLLPKEYRPFCMSGTPIIAILLVLWPADRMREKGVDRQLPLTVPLRLVSRYLLPALGVVLIGVTLGCLIAFRLNPANMGGYARLNLIALTIGACLMVYTFCTVVSTVWGMIPATVAGLMLDFPCFLSLGHPSSDFTKVEYRLLFVLLVAAVFWEVYVGKRRTIIGRLALPVLVALAIFGGSLRHAAASSHLPNVSSSPKQAYTSPIFMGEAIVAVQIERSL